MKLKSRLSRRSRLSDDEKSEDDTNDRFRYRNGHPNRQLSRDIDDDFPRSGVRTSRSMDDSDLATQRDLRLSIRQSENSLGLSPRLHRGANPRIQRRDSEAKDDSNDEDTVGTKRPLALPWKKDLTPRPRDLTPPPPYTATSTGQTRELEDIMGKNFPQRRGLAPLAPLAPLPPLDTMGEIRRQKIRENLKIYIVTI